MEKLTRDLTTDILSRLPTRSLLQSSRVCKSWYHIITADPTLSDLRNNRSTTNTNYIDALVLTNPDDLSPYQLHFIQLTHPHSTKKTHVSSFMHEKVFIQVVGVCNGVICLATFPKVVHFGLDFPGTLKLFHIINPLSKQHLRLHLPRFDEERKPIDISRLLYGFGFDKRNQVFKLVFFVFTANDDNVQTFIYTPASGWRRALGSVPCRMSYAIRIASNAYVDGCLHWITVTDNRLVILSFNLSDEAFGVIQTPESGVVEQSVFRMRKNYYRLAVLNNCLCWVDSCSYTHITIWIKKSDESWTKSFCLQRSLIAPDIRVLVKPIKVDQNGQLFLQYRGTVVCYNVQDNTAEFFNVDEEPEGIPWAEGFPFVGSFTSINSH